MRTRTLKLLRNALRALSAALLLAGLGMIAIPQAQKAMPFVAAASLPVFALSCYYHRRYRRRMRMRGVLSDD